MPETVFLPLQKPAKTGFFTLFIIYLSTLSIAVLIWYATPFVLFKEDTPGFVFDFIKWFFDNLKFSIIYLTIISLIFIVSVNIIINRRYVISEIIIKDQHLMISKFYPAGNKIIDQKISLSEINTSLKEDHGVVILGISEKGKRPLQIKSSDKYWKGPKAVEHINKIVESIKKNIE